MRHIYTILINDLHCVPIVTYGNRKCKIAICFDRYNDYDKPIVKNKSDARVILTAAGKNCIAIERMPIVSNLIDTIRWL